MEINRSSVIPIYMQICQIIESKISSGEYKSGSQMPSEMDIQKEYDVSRITARKAYKVLTDKGVLRAVRGKGTYINDIDQNDWTWMKRFTTEVISQNREPSSKIIQFKEIAAPEDVAGYLQIAANSAVYYIKRLRCIDNVPVWLTKSYIPVFLAEGLSKDYFSVKGVSQSIFNVLKLNFGIDFVSGQDVITNESASEGDIALLDMNESNNILRKAFVAKNLHGIPIVYENTLFEPNIVKQK